ncbi:hypothetical protein [Alloscardovia omnicolens]|uniref:hypothetical protein n=1 Tax=Alloscardovia omnicolens TaxID=419015 RepID=UPI003A692954
MSSRQHTPLHRDAQERVSALAHANASTSSTRWETLKMLKGSHKWRYFMQEFAWRIALVVLAVILVGYIGIQIVTPKPQPHLTVAMINMNANEEQTQALHTHIARAMHLNNSNDLAIDTNYSMDHNGLVKLQTLLSNSQVDVIIAPRAAFKELAGYGYLTNVSEQLSQEQSTDLQSIFVDFKGFNDSHADDMDYNGSGKGHSEPFGLSLQTSQVWNSIFDSQHSQDSVIGFAQNSSRSTAFQQCVSALHFSTSRE